MSRYIDAEWLKQRINVGFSVRIGKRVNNAFWSQMNKAVNSAPSIDIVRCVECRYKGMEICPMYKLTKAGVLKPYDFCSYGEREDE